MKRLEGFCKENNLLFGVGEGEKFSALCSALLAKNQEMNLTAITNPDEVEIKHFIDSLEGAGIIREMKAKSVIDMGTGAGFPGLPLAIELPDVAFTLADSLNKRINYIKETAEMLDLKNVVAIQGRAEELGQSPLRESFDVCVSRAVADTKVLAEYMLPFVKIGGCALLYKSENFEEELDSAANAIQTMGGVVKEVRKFHLPDGTKRSIIVVQKQEPTPGKYPRRPGKPSKSPIK